MMSFSIHLLLLATLLSLFVNPMTLRADETYIHHSCFNQGYKPGTTDETQLLSLMSLLTSKTTAGNGFSRVSLPQTAEDEVTGQALCRGDISQSDCEKCVKHSTSDLIQKCRGSVGAIAWYDKCMLKYLSSSARDIDYTMFEFQPQISISGASKVGEYFEGRYYLLSLLAEKASMGNLTLKFAVGYLNFTDSDKIYALMQCVPDMSTHACVECLNKYIVHNMYIPVQKWRVSDSNCDVRVAPMQFYDGSVNAPELYLPPPVARNDTIYTKGATHRYVLAIIILTICCMVLIASICIFLCLMRRKEKIPSINGQRSAPRLQIVRIENTEDQSRDQCGGGVRNERTIMEIPMLAAQNPQINVESSNAQDDTTYSWIAKTPMSHPSPR